MRCTSAGIIIAADAARLAGKTLAIAPLRADRLSSFVSHRHPPPYHSFPLCLLMLRLGCALSLLVE